MTPPLSTRLQWLGQHAWLHKSARTLLAVVPGLVFFCEHRGAAWRDVRLRRAVLVRSLWRPELPPSPSRRLRGGLGSPDARRRLATGPSRALRSDLRRGGGCSRPGEPLSHPAATGAHLGADLPLYEGSELHGEAWSTVVTAALLVAPAALWVQTASQHPGSCANGMKLGSNAMLINELRAARGDRVGMSRIRSECDGVGGEHGALPVRGDDVRYAFTPTTSETMGDHYLHAIRVLRTFGEGCPKGLVI
jgi:hypothetical protein